MEKKSIAESVDGFVRKDTSDGTQGLKQKSDVGSAAVYDDAVKEMRKSDDLAKANIEPAVKASDELARQTADTKGAPVPKTADLKAMHLSEGFAEYLGENFSGVSGNVVRCTDASKVRGLVECARRNGVRYSLRRIGEGFLFRFSGEAHALSEGRLDARQKKALRADLGDRVGSLGEDWTIARDCKDAEYPWGLSVGGKRYDSLSLGEGLKISRMGKDCLKESAPTIGTVKVRIDGTPEAEGRVYDYLTRESKAVDAGKVERKDGLVWVNDIGSIPAHALALDLAERFGVDCTVGTFKSEGLGAGGGKASKLDHLVKTSNSPVYASDLGGELKDRGIRFAFADTGVWVSGKDYPEAEDALSELEQRAYGNESLKAGRDCREGYADEHTGTEYCTMDCSNNNIDVFCSFDKAVESAKSDKEVCRILEVTYDLPADANGDIHESSAVEVWNRKDGLKESDKDDGASPLEPQYDGRKSFYGKATVRTFKDGRKVLYSYGTPVCRIGKDGKATLLDRGYYGWGSSNTTRRHVREFLRQNGLKADSSSQIAKDYPEEQARDDEGLEQAGGDYQVVLWECDGHMNPDYDSEVGCGRYGTLDEAVGSVKGAAKLSGGMIDEEYAVLDKSGNVVRTFFASTGKAAK